MSPIEPACDLLLLAAFGPELAGFDGLGVVEPSMRTTIGGLVVAARPVGIGLVSAAVGATVALEEERPRAVVLVGTCGAYPDQGLSIGDFAVARSVGLVDPAVVRDEAAFPGPMSTRVEAHAAMAAGLRATGGHLVDVATTLAVTTSDALAAEPASQRWAAEHLEAFAVATACALHETPFAVVLGVANAVGSIGRGQWRENHAEVGRAVGAFVSRWVLAGAAGVPHRT